ncbi:MAG: hypothetical protein MMC33_000470 [Icmadophila ericetorum]|nr:hypothetical protein [Icmadophila ericetorum]
MTSQLQYVKLAQSLPPRLLRFFARYPPPATAFACQKLFQPQSSTSTPLSTSSLNLDASPEEIASMERESLVPYENPFRSTKHPATGLWHDPVYSLRRQADLVKLARAHGVEELLPLTTKGTEERTRKRDEFGLRVKGTGVGQRVKGKMWERTMKGRLEKRKQAMLEMPAMIQLWKQRGHGRGWKKYPK